MWGMLKAEILQTESSIFHRTVLEGYWEFGARIGTKMKLTVSAFSSFRLFLFSKTTKLLNFWKCVKISFQNTTLTSRVWANTLDKYRDIAFWRYVYSRISKKVSTLNACAIWWASGEKIVPLENKNNVMHISPEWNCLPVKRWTRIDNYFHDHHPPKLCQSSVLRVCALKIWSHSEQSCTYWLDHKLTL